MRPRGWLAQASPSRLWWAVRGELAPWLTPGEYIRKARADGLSWREVGELLLEDTGVKVGCPSGTCDYWANVDRTEDTAA